MRALKVRAACRALVLHFYSHGRSCESQTLQPLTLAKEEERGVARNFWGVISML